jgi:hypothetical protein
MYNAFAYHTHLPLPFGRWALLLPPPECGTAFATSGIFDEAGSGLCPIFVSQYRTSPYSSRAKPGTLQINSADAENRAADLSEPCDVMAGIAIWRNDDMDKLPSLNKKFVNVTSLDDIEEEKKYWFSKSPLERIEAIEINRRMIYGQDRVTSRLQRFFETSELS